LAAVDGEADDEGAARGARARVPVEGRAARQADRRGVQRGDAGQAEDRHALPGRRGPGRGELQLSVDVGFRVHLELAGREDPQFDARGERAADDELRGPALGEHGGQREREAVGQGLGEDRREAWGAYGTRRGDSQQREVEGAGGRGDAGLGAELDEQIAQPAEQRRGVQRRRVPAELADEVGAGVAEDLPEVAERQVVALVGDLRRIAAVGRHELEIDDPEQGEDSQKHRPVAGEAVDYDVLEQLLAEAWRERGDVARVGDADAAGDRPQRGGDGVEGCDRLGDRGDQRRRRLDDRADVFVLDRRGERGGRRAQRLDLGDRLGRGGREGREAVEGPRPAPGPLRQQGLGDRAGELLEGSVVAHRQGLPGGAGAEGASTLNDATAVRKAHAARWI